MFCQILKAHLIVCYFDLELAIAVPVFYGEPNLHWIGEVEPLGGFREFLPRRDESHDRDVSLLT